MGGESPTGELQSVHQLYDCQGISGCYQLLELIKSPTHQAEKSDVRRHSTSQSEQSKQGTNAEQEEEGAATKAAHQPLTQDPLPASFCTLRAEKNQSDEHDGGEISFRPQIPILGTFIAQCPHRSGISRSWKRF